MPGIIILCQLFHEIHPCAGVVEEQMHVLICNPGLTFQSDAPLITRLRARAIQETGIEVMIMGYLPSFAAEFGRHGLPYTSVETGLNPKTRLRFATWKKRLGNYWIFIAEPAIVIWQALRYAANHAVDVIYMSHPEPWLVLACWLLFPRRSKLHLVALIPLAFRRDPNSMRGFSLPSKFRWVLNTWACRFLPRFIHLICDNRHVPSVMGIARWPSVHVVPEGHRDLISSTNTVEARQRLGIPVDQRMLLMFGVASPVKGADLLLKVLENVEPSFNVFIVGQTGGVYQSNWGNPERLYQSGWKDHLFIVARHVSNEEMNDYFSACDAIILPYRKGYETTSANLRQAIERGKAILASDQYCLGDTVRNYRLGLLFPPGNAEALRDCLLEFAGKPDAWFDAVRKQCAVMNRDYDWQTIGRQYTEVFNSILRMDLKRQ